jgi:hypothetical protein
MAKEWILNSVMNRFQLNFKRNVGPTSESIRKCAPKTVEEWRDYYFSNVKPEEHITELGRKLYVKITEVIEAEVASVTEEDCIAYMIQLVIDRTFDGYMTEIKTVYGQLEQLLGVTIEPAPDEWDRLFNVDFFIRVGRNLSVCKSSRSLLLEEVCSFLKFSRRNSYKKKRTENLLNNLVARFSTYIRIKVGKEKRYTTRM